MAGILLDTHALYWLVSGDVVLTDDALVAIGDAQQAGALLVSSITAWELAVASRKKRIEGRPHLGRDTPDRWFRDAVAATEARVVAIESSIAIEAANVVADTGHKDPGDCFLIATARIRNATLVTRDATIQAIASARPDYLNLIAC